MKKQNGISNNTPENTACNPYNIGSKKCQKQARRGEFLTSKLLSTTVKNLPGNMPKQQMFSTFSEMLQKSKRESDDDCNEKLKKKI